MPGHCSLAGNHQADTAAKSGPLLRERASLSLTICVFRITIQTISEVRQQKLLSLSSDPHSHLRALIEICYRYFLLTIRERWRRWPTAFALIQLMLTAIYLNSASRFIPANCLACDWVLTMKLIFCSCAVFDKHQKQSQKTLRLVHDHSFSLAKLLHPLVTPRHGRRATIALAQFLEATDLLKTCDRFLIVYMTLYRSCVTDPSIYPNVFLSQSPYPMNYPVGGYFGLPHLPFFYSSLYVQ